MAEVVLEGVSKRYPNGVEAVRDLTLTVADGELIVLVGPSGCGKTTTLRLIAGLEELTAGTIRIGGRVVNTLPPRQRDVAMVFQRPALYPHLTVRENLAFGLRLRLPGAWGRWSPFGQETYRHRQRVIQDRVERAAQMLQLGELLDRLPAHLSGGQQQRVALGRALVREPASFLLDEPLSNLDARLRTEMRRELHLLHGRLHATMIYVTHDQVEALTLGDRVVVLRQGVAEQVDRPQALYERPCNRFVAGFLGWPSMNFLDGELVHQGGRPCFAGEGVALPLPADVAAAWQAYAGRPLTLGIRPEDVRLAPGAQDGAVVMDADVVETLGASGLATLHRQGWQVTVRVETGTMVHPRQPVAFNLDRAHLFDRATGQALRHGRPDG
jgi:multiple sugar transport system ATP-binding protein